MIKEVHSALYGGMHFFLFGKIAYLCNFPMTIMKNKYYLILAALLASQSITTFAQSNYLLPLRIAPSLSGNFGEIRSGHIHTGIDFKTQGRTGFPIRAMADGYISKIFVSYGSGYMLHITYNNGYTAIYRHNEAFAPKIARYTRKYQYEHEVDLCEITVPEGVLPVVRGEVLGNSGNEGYSMGPHLHLDLYETATGDFVDPLPHLAQVISDNRAPLAESFLIVPQAGSGVINGSGYIGHPSSTDNVIECWGKIGIAIDPVDYMDGASNKLGVKHIRLTVDQREVYRSDLDRLSREENNRMHNWLIRGHLKSYTEPGLFLRFIKTDERNGILTISEERDYQVAYTLADEAGNEREYSFILRGKEMPIPQPNYQGMRCLKWNQVNDLSMPGMQLILPRGVLACDEYVDPRAEAGEYNASMRYMLSSKSVVLGKSCELRISLPALKSLSAKQYYIARQDGEKRTYAGNAIREGFCIAQIGSLDTYSLEMDTIAPLIKPSGTKARWQSQGVLDFIISDSQTPVVSYKGKIDGKFELFHLRRRTGHTTCNLKECQIPRGKTHTLEITATDACGNTRIYKDTFTW